ncbi:MAG: ABC transporter substrate-binding protein, partial [Dehalococcoidia bacterium]|nr:ABC transporter substrate-binding protein [Dehalococcoidia bacterium]
PKPAATPTATPTAAPLATATPTRPGPAATPTPTSAPVVAPTPTPSPAKIKRGGVLRRGVLGDPAGFDPMMHVYAPTDPQSNSNLYSYLLVSRAGPTVECDLCTEWKIEDGGKTLVFNLVKNASFEDGSPLTSKDVVYSLKKMVGQIQGQAVSARCGLIKEYLALAKDFAQPFEAPDAYTVKIHLAAPSGAVPQIMAQNWCAILKDGTTTKDVTPKPNGSGPFRIGKWNVGASMQLVPTPNYWRKDSTGVQLPYLDQLENVVIKDDSVLLAAVVSGRLDMAGSTTVRDAGPDAVKLVEEFVKQGKGRVYWTKPASNGGAIMNVTKPPFNNIKLRNAVNLVLDRKSHQQIVFSGRADVALYQSPDYVGARTAEEVWDKIPGWGTGAKKAAEVEQAKQLMKEAGFGSDFSMTVLCYTGSGLAKNTAEWIIPQLQRLGVKAELKCYESTAPLFTVMAALDYGIAAYIYGYGLSDPDVMLGSYFITGGNRNWSGVSDPRIDALYQQEKAELDPQKRIQLTRQAEDILLELTPWGPLPMGIPGYLLSRNWGGWDPALGTYFHNRHEYGYDTRVQ